MLGAKVKAFLLKHLVKRWFFESYSMHDRSDVIRHFRYRWLFGRKTHCAGTRRRRSVRVVSPTALAARAANK